MSQFPLKSSPAVMQRLRWVGGALSGLAIALAWNFPGQAFSAHAALLAMVALFFFCERSKNPLQVAYIGGVTSSLFGFPWLYFTISYFGKLPAFISALIFALFVLTSALQFPLSVWLAQKIRGFPILSLFPLAISWTVVEFLFPRIFPWQIGHTQLALPMAQLADVAGSLLVSFALCAAAEHLARGFTKMRISQVGVTVLLLAHGLGAVRIVMFSNFADPSPARQEVLLVQANISVEEKHDARMFANNRERYERITTNVVRDGQLVIWPESVLQEWFYEGLGNTKNDPRLPNFGPKVDLLSGALTFRDRNTFFNSALVLQADGTIPLPYHKQILMPFGEFMPFSHTFPILRELNPNAGEFEPGDGVKVFSLPGINSRESTAAGKATKIAPLICYEDVIPSLARQATRAGANLLVNLTNDAWFGNSMAPYQHHLIASFRAIENRRVLIRSTNSGFSAIVDPLGGTTNAIAPFSEGYLMANVPLFSYKSPYTDYTGDWPWLVLSIVTIIAAFLATLGKWKNKKVN